MIIQNTLLLDQDAWDFVLDINGNIAMALAPYSIAQDVASSARTFLGECWYNTDLGIPYWQQILGELPPLQYVSQKYVSQALTIPNVVSAQVKFSNFQDRILSGKILTIDSDGTANSAAFGGF